MKETKKKTDLSTIAGSKLDKNGSSKSSEILHNSLTNVPEAEVNIEVQQSLANEVKSIKIKPLAYERNFDAARNSGQRAFAKKNSRRSHYITKK
ncbi:MAG: hypothetical protein ABI543_06310 [Ignavibacteria bacterium]